MEYIVVTGTKVLVGEEGCVRKTHLEFGMAPDTKVVVAQCEYFHLQCFNKCLLT